MSKMKCVHKQYEKLGFFNKGFYYISIYEKKTKTTPPSIIIASKKTMEEVLELIDANVFGVK